MKVNIANDLNPAQQQAVTHTEGPILILAGAGSGKTRVLTYKVAYLIIEKNIPAEQILMVTFTNKAANEMKERIKKLLQSHTLSTYNYQLPIAGTFHSLCAKILRREGRYSGLPIDFVIYDTQDQKELVKMVMNKLNISQKQYHPNAILNTISQAKNELIGPSAYPQYAFGTFQKIVASVYTHYQDALKQNHALDFDDLLMATVDLFKQNTDVLTKYQMQFRYILVDEYQDTNHAQYTLTKLLSDHHRNLCVVGDASQSIYAWRGANFQNILNFKNDFPQAHIFHLEQNYRSTQTILDAAYSVISKNTSHPILKLWTDNEQGQQVTTFAAYNEQSEAQFILSEIAKENFALDEVAILYRTNAQSRVIEEVLLHEGIPYVLVGGVSFYERKEIKDVISFLRLIINPDEQVARARVTKIGKKRAELFYEVLHEQLKQKSTLELLELVLITTNYLELYDPNNADDAQRIENIKELRSVASSFPQLTEFLENVALVEAAYRPKKSPRIEHQNQPSITLMTIHSAKGLEFPVVFMIGMEEGLFPHSRALLDSAELEEERRLCYVGITRAKNHLYLTYANHRLYFGSRSSNSVSRFIADIPEALLTQSSLESDYLTV